MTSHHPKSSPTHLKASLSCPVELKEANKKEQSGIAQTTRTILSHSHLVLIKLTQMGTFRQICLSHFKNLMTTAISLDTTNPKYGTK